MWFTSLSIFLSFFGITLAQQGTFAQPGYEQGQYYPQQQPQQLQHPQHLQAQQQPPQQPPQKPSPYLAPPTGFLHNQALDGTYNFAYQTKDGQTRAEHTGTDGSIRGSYFYTSPEGQNVKVSYTADKNGFHADSDAIPKAPLPSSPPPQPSHPQYLAQQPQYSPPQPQYVAPQPQYAPQPQSYSNPRPQPVYSNTPIAQYSYGDPNVLSSLQKLFQG